MGILINGCVYIGQVDGFEVVEDIEVCYFQGIVNIFWCDRAIVYFSKLICFIYSRVYLLSSFIGSVICLLVVENVSEVIDCVVYVNIISGVEVGIKIIQIVNFCVLYIQVIIVGNGVSIDFFLVCFIVCYISIIKLGELLGMIVLVEFDFIKAIEIKYFCNCQGISEFY